MIPILYSKTETSFSTNGIGALSDAISCVVTEERNGVFELIMEYPMTGIHYEAITYDALIKAKANELDDGQPFRIYYISKPINGIITIQAEHISYQLSHIPVSPFTASNASEALMQIKVHSVIGNPFTFSTDKTTTADMDIPTPTSCRTALVGQAGSVIDTYGGELKFDKYNVYLYNQRGADNGVKIAYGKNLIDLKQEENISNVITGVYPFWQKDDVLVTLPEKVVSLSTSYSYPRVISKDFTSDFEEEPTQGELRDKATEYINQSGISLPAVSITVDFVNLGDTEEYKHLKGLERVSLCDIVTVEFERLGVSAKAKVVKTVYNTLLEKYDKLEIGNAKPNIAVTIAEQQQVVEQAATMSFLQKAILRATSLITGNLGGYVVFRPAEKPEEILIMDTPDTATAVKVWRWNLSGLGYSGSGIDGPYETAITMDGAINGKFISAASIEGASIKTSTLMLDKLISTSGKNKINVTGDSSNYAFVFENDTKEVLRMHNEYGVANFKIGDSTSDTYILGGRGGQLTLGKDVATNRTKVYLFADDITIGGTSGYTASIGSKKIVAKTATISGTTIDYWGWE